MRAAFALIAVISLSACQPAADIVVEKARYQPPYGASGVGAAYFSIRSRIKDRIVGVTSSGARAVEIHESQIEGTTTRMRRLDGVDLPAGETVRFATGGLHVMVIDPQPLGPSATFPLTITLQSGRTEELTIPAIKPGQAAD